MIFLCVAFGCEPEGGRKGGQDFDCDHIQQQGQKGVWSREVATEEGGME